MTRIYLCDENKQHLTKYSAKIEEIAQKNDISVSITTFTNSDQLLFHMSDVAADVDIIYLDTVIGKTNGIELVKKLKNINCLSEIIFLSSSKEDVFAALDVRPFHYIVKDSFNEDKFEEIFLEAVSRIKRKTKKMFLFESGAIKKQVPISQIEYFEVSNRVMTVHFNNQIFQFYSSMEKLEFALKGKGFSRCHRSFLVNLSYIDEIRKKTIKLRSGEVIPAGAAYIKDVKNAFSLYHTSHFS